MFFGFFFAGYSLLFLTYSQVAACTPIKSVYTLRQIYGTPAISYQRRRAARS
jgi:hypothetical protein